MRKPAEVFPPGSFVQEELEARGLDFIEVRKEFREGGIAVDWGMAVKLATLFTGTSPRCWLNLQKAWDQRRKSCED